MLIGMSGFIGSGKDAVGKILADHGWTKVAFAEPLRQAVLTLDPYVYASLNTNYTEKGNEVGFGGDFEFSFDITHMRFSRFVEIVGWDRAKRECPEVRRLLQVMGTEVGRNLIDQNLWVNLAEQAITHALDNGRNVVVTDVRFMNEVALIQRLGGWIVWVERPGVTCRYDHASERTLDPNALYITRVLRNHGTLEDLAVEVERLLADMRHDIENPQRFPVKDAF